MIPLLSQGKILPNILWITAEDMSPAIGCYGNTDAITPNIDELAKNSIKFTNAFASAPVCSPSRSCLIQGTSPLAWEPSTCGRVSHCHQLLRDFPPTPEKRLLYY